MMRYFYFIVGTCGPRTYALTINDKCEYDDIRVYSDIENIPFAVPNLWPGVIFAALSDIYMHDDMIQHAVTFFRNSLIRRCKADLYEDNEKSIEVKVYKMGFSLHELLEARNKDDK